MRQPPHGIAVVSDLSGTYAVIADDAVFLKYVHHLLLVGKAGLDPVLKFVAHFLTESLTTLRRTRTTSSQNIEALIESIIVVIVGSNGQRPEENSDKAEEDGGQCDVKRIHCLAIIRNPTLASA